MVSSNQGNHWLDHRSCLALAIHSDLYVPREDPLYASTVLHHGSLRMKFIHGRSPLLSMDSELLSNSDYPEHLMIKAPTRNACIRFVFFVFSTRHNWQYLCWSLYSSYLYRSHLRCSQTHPMIQCTVVPSTRTDL